MNFKFYLSGTLLIIMIPLLAIKHVYHSTQATTTAWTGADIWDGTSGDVIQNGTLLVSNGRITGIFSGEEHSLPQDVEIVDVTGKFIVPGLINAHGHIGASKGLSRGPAAQSIENVIDQLKLSARYGITTVVSLGDGPPTAFEVRNSMEPSSEGMARLYLAGPVLNPSSEQEANEQVDELMDREPDWTKIRVDDNLGTGMKMPESVYRAVIEASHRHQTPLAAHIVTLEDAKGVVINGADLVAHSVRDLPVDDELIRLMKDRNVCITPTLTREVSVFIYADKPVFFDDPYFLKEADQDVIEQLQQPAIQQNYRGPSADFYREALPLASSNMMMLHNAGVKVAMGTDSGMPARFQGYFEQMEMEMMQDAGMAPVDVLRSATGIAAECMRIGEDVGTLETEKKADFLILKEDPLVDIRNLREPDSVYIGGILVQ